MIQAQTAAPRGYLLGTAEGEHLVHFRDAGSVVIKVSSATGFDTPVVGAAAAAA